MAEPEPDTICSYQRDDGSWGCSRAAADNRCCPLHQPGSVDGETLLRTLETGTLSSDADDEAEFQLFDIEFGAIELPHRSIAVGGRYPIAFEGSSVEALNLENAVLEHPLDLSGARISGDVILKGARVKGDLNLGAERIDGDLLLQEVNVEGDLVLSGLDVSGELRLESADISGDLRMVDSTVARTTFATVANLKGATVDGAVQLGSETSESIIAGNLNLSELTCRSTLTMTSVEVRGDIDGERLTASSISLETCEAPSLNLSSCRLAGSLRLDDAEFNRATLSDGRIQQDLKLKQVEAGRIDANRVQVGGQVTAEHVELIDSGDLEFKRSQVNGKLTIENAGGPRPIEFSDGQLNLFRSTLQGPVQVERVQFSKINISEVTCNRDLTLDAMSTSGGFEAIDAEFHGDVHIEDGRLVGGRIADEGGDSTEVPGQDLAHSTFHQQLRLHDVTLPAGLSIDDSPISYLNITGLDAPDGGPVRISLVKSRVDRGYISERQSDRLHLNCRHATLGEIDLDTSPGRNPLSMVRLLETEFDGFDFSSYRAALRRRDWQLHDAQDHIDVLPESPAGLRAWLLLLIAPLLRAGGTLRAGWRITHGVTETGASAETSSPDEAAESDAKHSSRDTNPRDDAESDRERAAPDDNPLRRLEALETTYAKAKNGATQVGDDAVAGEFLREETYMRQVITASALFSPASSDRGRRNALFGWLEMSSLQVASGYGERPLQVVWSSLVVVFLFGWGLLPLVGQLVGEQASLLTWLTLSAGSFVSLFTSSPAVGKDHWIQLIAQLEGFIGALLIALFVFTLTRAIHR